MDALRFPSPSSAASLGLNAALDERDRIASELRALEQSQRDAASAARDASASLAELERRAASQPVGDAERKHAERAVADAKAKAGEPWSERRDGLSRALQDASDAVGRFAGEHWRDLAAELADDAREVKVRCDAALCEISDAYQARAHVEQRALALLSLVGGPRAGSVPHTRLEAVAQAVDAALLAGGEVAPVPVRRVIEGAVLEPERVAS
ncbi:hypothetical protein [Solirubrobacter soli]|uniref:hypothetical protein n=1 Tax=Solirubrobacter soli TaxID=363832 RepID=UPI000413C6C1|nr:hypothetical protein [Solirubrobacter soli]